MLESWYMYWGPNQAKSFASSGKMMEDFLGDIPLNEYSETLGLVEGIPYENDGGKNIAQDIVKRWYEEKTNYNGHSYSPEIANFTCMLWNASDGISCAMCSKNSNSHYIVCIYTNAYSITGENIPINNSDATLEQFKKNVFFINDDPTTRTFTLEKKSTTEDFRSKNQKPATLIPTYKTFEKETTIQCSTSSTPYHYKSRTACPLMKTLLAGILDMCNDGVTPSHGR